MTSEELYDLLKDTEYFEYFPISNYYNESTLTREELIERYNKEMAEHEKDVILYNNPYVNILNFESKYISSFAKGDHIVVQEKIDGSNSHIIVTEDGFKAFSSKRELNDYFNNQGFYFWAKKNYIKVPKKYYNYALYGEWLAPHHNVYPKERYGDFYLFDVLEGANPDGTGGIYWTQDRVKQVAEECGFKYAPVMFDGEFSTWKEIMKYVGQTRLGGEKGEGIVVKNQTRLNNRTHPFYTKIVDVEFQETNASRRVVKTVDMNKILELEEKQAQAYNVVTLARVRKILLKLVDEKEIQPNWYKVDMKQYLNKVRSAVYYDCIKECKEVVDSIGKSFGKYNADIVADHVRTLQNEYK
jgi:hypothetical protein